MSTNKIEDIRKHHGDRAAQKAAERAAQTLPQVGDRYGRVLQIGDRVHYNQSVDLLCEVLDIVPILDPRAPAGAVTIVLGTTIPLQTQARAVLGKVTRIWSAQEIAAMEAEQAGHQAPEPEPMPGPAPDPSPTGAGIVLTDLERKDDAPAPEQPAAPEPAPWAGPSEPIGPDSFGGTDYPDDLLERS